MVTMEIKQLIQMDLNHKMVIKFKTQNGEFQAPYVIDGFDWNQISIEIVAN